MSHGVRDRLGSGSAGLVVADPGARKRQLGGNGAPGRPLEHEKNEARAKKTVRASRLPR